MRTTEIYIQLLDEGTVCYRPTTGEEIGDGVYRVLPTDHYDPEDEVWEFAPGSMVRCAVKTLRNGEPREVLVAVEKVMSSEGPDKP